MPALGDKSRFCSPAITDSVVTNLDGSAGAQFFDGGAGSEYGSFNRLYYTHLQYFF